MQTGKGRTVAWFYGPFEGIRLAWGDCREQVLLLLLLLCGLNKESTELPVGGAMQNVIELIHHDSPWLWFSLVGLQAAQNDDGVYLHGCWKTVIKFARQMLGGRQQWLAWYGMPGTRTHPQIQFIISYMRLFIWFTESKINICTDNYRYSACNWTGLDAYRHA